MENTTPPSAHIKKPHGLCLVCGHYGSDCTGREIPAFTDGRWEAQRDEHGTWSVHAIHRRGPIELDHHLAIVRFRGAEAEANARLMAAAPDLLELARSFRNACDSRISILQEERAEPYADVDDLDDQIGHWTSLLSKCEAAIAKAVPENR
jgi:hypothetical protein